MLATEAADCAYLADLPGVSPRAIEGGGKVQPGGDRSSRSSAPGQEVHLGDPGELAEG